MAECLFDLTWTLLETVGSRVVPLLDCRPRGHVHILDPFLEERGEKPVTICFCSLVLCTI